MANYPTPGHPIERAGKRYLYATWLAKLMGGGQCLWSVWFRGKYKYAKFEQDASNLPEWNRAHTRLMQQRRAQLEREGYRVFWEEDTEWKLEGQRAVLAGKCDIVAVRPDLALISDGKTGRERESDVCQVLLYLYALPKCRPDLVGDRPLEGEVFYKHGEPVSVTPDALTPQRVDAMVQLIQIVSADEAPLKAPSRGECRFCSIGPKDCPERFSETRRGAPAALATEF